MKYDYSMTVERPIVVCDGVIIICAICDKAYIPEESISLDGLVSALKESLISHSSPKFLTGTGEISRKTSRTAQRTQNRTFFRSTIRSDGETDSDEHNTFGYSPSKPKSSTSSSFSSGMPNSILLPLRTERLGNIGNEEFDDVFVDAKTTRLQNRLIEQINWMKTQGRDCIALETLSSIKEIVIMVQVFLRSKAPAALEFKVNQNSTITVSYQILHNFKNDFMMLKVNEKYCMFMSPF